MSTSSTLRYFALKNIILIAFLLAALFLPIKVLAFSMPSTVPTQSVSASFTVNYACSLPNDYCYLQERTSGTEWDNVHYQQGPTPVSTTLTRSLGSHTFRLQRCKVTGTRFGTSSSCTYDNSRNVNIVRAPSSSPAARVNNTTNIESTTGSLAISFSAVAYAGTYTLFERANGGSWRNIGNFAVGVTNLSRNDGAYEFKVRACNAGLCASDGPIASAVVTKPPGLPSVPVFSTESPSDGTFNVTWSAASGAVTSYEWQRLGDGETSINTVPSNTRAIYEIDLAQGNYSYRIRACNSVATFTSCSAWRASTQMVVALQSGTPEELITQSPVNKLPPYQGSPFAAQPDPVADATDDDHYYGSLSGVESVGHAGEFQYVLPIDVPETIGLTPSLSIVYNSLAGNGMMGMGWSLQGLSEISRCKASLARDGRVSGINSGDNYGYCLDGQRLIETSTGKYITEVDNGLIVSKETNSWVVKNKNGKINRYGLEEDSISFDSNNQAYKWRLTQVEDVFGNSYTIDYESETGLPLSINYTVLPFGASTGHRINFEYESRQDTLGSYFAGAYHFVGKRLSKIAMTHQSKVLFEYQVSYLNTSSASFSDMVHKSRLNSIKKCYYSDGSMGCSDPIDFTWERLSSQSYAMYPSPTNILERYEEYFLNTPYGYKRVLDIDINGDGILQPYYAPECVEVSNCPKYIAADVDGDGYTDVIKVELREGRGIYVYFNQKEPFSEEREISSDHKPGFHVPNSRLRFLASRREYITEGYGPNGDRTFVHDNTANFAYDYQFADVVGNGRPDLVLLPPGCTESQMRCVWDDRYPNDIEILINSGGGFSEVNRNKGPIPWSNISSLSHFGQFRYEVMDINGDGIADIRAIGSTPNPPSLMFYREFVAINNGLTSERKYFDFVQTNINWSSVQGYVGDFNGDGVPDHLQMPMQSFLDGAPKIQERFTVALGTGASLQDYKNRKPGVSPPKLAYQGSFIKQCGVNRAKGDICHRVVVDYNGDGLDDIVEIGYRRIERCKASTSSLCDEDLWDIADFQSRVYLSLGADKDGAVSFYAHAIASQNGGYLWPQYFHGMTESDFTRLRNFMDYNAKEPLKN